jgi:multisubunit Na+/H+ antiporter MnhB subunit
MAKFDGTKIIIGAISIIIGLVLLPVMGGFANQAKNNNSTKEITGVTNLIDLILYGFTFGLVGLGVGLIYIGFKGK